MDNLSEEEKERLNNILQDFKVIFDKKKIKLSKIDDLKSQLKSKEVFSYLNALRGGSKPESALREELLAGVRSILGKFLFGEMKVAEASEVEGFIDYKLETKEDYPILFELKPLFEHSFKHEEEGPRLHYLHQSELNWEDHKSQIEKYLRKNEFLILTNLKEWYFFSKRSRKPMNTKALEFEKFYEDFRRVGDLLDYLERFEVRSIKGELDKRFFNSLKTWVSWLRSVEFKEEISEKEKIEAIIKLINKFIFIQTLDDHFVIDFRWISKNWNDKVRKWQQLGKKKVLRKFLDEVNEWFYTYYDTELFRGDVLDFIKKSKNNIDLFYDKLKKVLGVEHWQRASGERGIINYPYRKIDEDIFGKAYETFLAEIRKERGIFYTPKYITQYIVENTVGKKFDEIIDEFKENLKKRNFDKAQRALKELVSITVLDLACGSGSFLIKTIRIIWKKYQKVINLLRQEEDKFKVYKGTLKISKKEEEFQEEILKLREILDYSDQRDLISKIILRHVHGNDLDKRAIDIAKLNIWLEAIKLTPTQFRYDKIPSGKGYVLPDLEISLGNVNSLVGLPEDKTIRFLKENFKKELKRMSKLRREYLKNPTKEEVIEELNKVKQRLKKEVNKKFKQYLEENNLPEEILQKTKPFHWALDFWYVYFDDNTQPKPKEQQGFDVVIGNPPYIDYRSVEPLSTHGLLKKNYYSCMKNPEKYNIFVPFIEKGITRLRYGGLFGYINPIHILSSLMSRDLREYILKNFKIEEIVDLSSLNVFREAATYPILFFYQE